MVLSLEEAPPYEGPVTVKALRDSMALKGIGGLRSEARVRVKRGGKGLGTYKGALAFEGPDLLRLRVYGAFATTGLEAVHARGRLQIFIPQEGVLYEGESPAYADDLTYSVRDTGGDYELLVHESHDGANRLQASYVFDRETLLNREVNFYDAGEMYLRISFARYLGGVPMSASIELYGGYSAEVELIEPERVEDLPDELFGPIPRGHAMVMPLELIVEQAR
ncbi:MAG: hypothetical protein PVJ36_05785 [Nitrospirota bacterium]|jgi:hypothetical protein